MNTMQQITSLTHSDWAVLMQMRASDEDSPVSVVTLCSELGLNSSTVETSLQVLRARRWVTLDGFFNATLIDDPFTHLCDDEPGGAEMTFTEQTHLRVLIEDVMLFAETFNTPLALNARCPVCNRWVFLDETRLAAHMTQDGKTLCEGRGLQVLG